MAGPYGLIDDSGVGRFNSASRVIECHPIRLPFWGDTAAGAL